MTLTTILGIWAAANIALDAIANLLPDGRPQRILRAITSTGPQLITAIRTAIGK